MQFLRISITNTIAFIFLESKICSPNPCKHNGKCKVVKDRFKCDCEGTFYRGITCERGTLIIPEIPLMTINQTKSNLIIQGYPDNKIKITLVPSASLSIKPKVITLTKNKTTAMYSVTGNRSGFFNIKYKISGENADEFDTPESTLVFVDKANKTVYSPICYQCGGVLKKGCFSINDTSKVVLSNLQWSVTKTTKGITQILAYEDRTLPLSLTGGQIVSSPNKEIYRGANIMEAVNASNFSSNCSDEGEIVFNVGNIFRTNTFEYTIQVFFNRYSPSWFKLIAALKTNEYMMKDLVSELYLGSELEKKSDECISGFQFKKNNTYYIHQTNQKFNILLPNNYVELPSFTTKCIIIDLKDKHIYFGFSKNKYINGRTIKIYRAIISRFSADLSFLIGSEVISSKISFEMVKKFYKVNVVGKQKYSLNFTKVNVTIITEGRMSFKYDENLNYHTEMILAENNFVDFSFAFLVNGRMQYIKMKGHSSTTNSHKERKSNTTAKVTAGVFPVKYFFQTESLKKTFSLSNLSPISVYINYSRLVLPIPLDTIKQKLLNQVNKSKNIVKETITFLESLSLPIYLQTNLEILKNFTRKLSAILLSYPQRRDSFFTEIESIRLVFLENLKMFSLLLDQYIETDIMDRIGMELKFINFENRYNKFVQNTNVNSSQKFSVAELSYAVIGSRGQFCIEYICFKNLNLTVHIKLQKVVGQFVKWDNIGNYIEIPPFSKVEYNLTNEIKSANLKGRITVFNQVEKIDISIKESLLSFNVNAKFENVDLIPLHVEASLGTVIKDDPLYFVFSGNMNSSTKLRSDIKNAIRNYFKNLEDTLQTRKALILASSSSTKVLFYQVSNSTKLVIMKLEQLKTGLERLDANLSDTANQTRFQKEKYKQSLKKNANITSNQLDQLVKECKPMFCESMCIPGYKRKVCYKQRQVPLVEQHCYLQNISTVFYKHIQVEKTVTVTNYVKKYDCWEECPVLKKILGKRKRREIANDIIEKAFEELGGKEAKLGVKIGAIIGSIGGSLIPGVGNVLGSIIGEITGGFIGSFFGSCKRYCAFDYVPVPGYLILKQYEKRPVVKQITKSKCKNEVRYINGSTESVYECSSKSNCSELSINNVCMQKQQECNHFRKNVTVSLADKSSIEKLFCQLTKTSFTYDLLIIKRNMFLQQLQKAEQELKIARALNKSAYNSYVSTEKSLEKFEEVSKNDKLMTEKYKNQPTLFKPDGLKLNFTYLPGMKFPEKFLIEIELSGSTSTVLFDVNNYRKSVQDISLKIRDLVEETESGKRKKRSIANSKPDQLDKKCLAIQNAEMFLLEVLIAFRKKLDSFTNQNIFSAQQIKANENVLESIKENISIQFDSLVDDSTKKLLTIELNEIFRRKVESEKEVLQTFSWNSTLTETIVELQLFVNDMQQNECANLLDCLQFYTNSIKNLLQFEESRFSLNITEKVENWKSNILQLITSYPNINNSRQLIMESFNSLAEINPRHWFCGSPPSLKTLLEGKTEIKEGEDLYLKVDILEEKYSYIIIWKRNNFILPSYNTTILHKVVNVMDQGYYSCEISNTFGTSHCGNIFVKVFSKIKFSIEPQDSVGYLNFPKGIYLTCAIKNNVSEEGSFTWFFRRFDAPIEKQELLPISGPYIEIKQDTSNRSGFYSCIYSNKLVSARSREAVVHILRTTVATERIRITMLLSKLTRARGRRQINDNTSDINLELIKLLQIKPSQIEINSFARKDYQKDTIVFTLFGNNLTFSLQNSTRDALNEKILKERRDLLLRSVLLHYHANITSNLTVKGKNYTIDEDSISVENLGASCPEGQSLSANGFICGK